MFKNFVIVIAAVLIVSACAPQTATEPPSLIIEDSDGGNSSGDGELNPTEYEVVKQLAENLELPMNEIEVIQNTPIEFSDSCLGITMQDMMCAQVITPGRIIELEANDVQYEYHVSEDGSRIQPATLALTWSRDGGFAGFCDRLTVFLSGEVYGSRCGGDGRMGVFSSLLSIDERDRFSAWMEKYGVVIFDASDPKGVADGMSLVIEFHGLGKGKPGKPAQQEIFNWAQDLFPKLYE